MKIKKHICLFASQSNSSFVINEIIQLSETFERVTVVVMDNDVTEHNLPDNTTVIKLSYNDYATTKVLKKHLLAYLSILFVDLWKSPKSIFYRSIMTLNMSKLLRAFYLSDSIAKLSLLSEDYILYSFWFDGWATSLSILKKRDKIKDFFSLTHGFDLYEHRRPVTRKIPYRWFQLKYVSKVYSVSKMGETYLKNKYPKYEMKIHTAYLQTVYYDQNPLNTNRVTLLTCANFGSVKRIPLILKILQEFTVPVTWIYIGSIDPENSEVKNFLKQVEELQVGNPLVEINVVGKLTNEEVFSFYSKNAVSALLSVSESEGLPVSMMEAISFGIPVISTDVGGCSEIVNYKTGVLLPVNFEPKAASKIIIEFLQSGTNTSLFRKGIVNYWEYHFSKNRIKFLDKFGLVDTIRDEKKVCSRCVMDSDCDTSITFNTKGVCSYCNYYDNQIAILGSVEQRKKWINDKIIEIVANNKTKNYDCILGVSGGVDSTYLAYWCKQNGLRPLVVHFDNGWNSELAVKNIENICTILNLELNTYVIKWEEFKELQLAYLKAGVVDIEVLTDHAIYATLTKIAKQYNISYVLSGFNLATEAIMPKSWIFDKTDWVNIKDIYKKFGSGKSIKSYPHISFFKKLYNYWFFKLETIQVLNYIDYNKNNAKELITKELSWVDYGGKHYESIFTKFYQSYILPVKFKIDKRQAHLATLICSNQITKEEALKELQLNPYNEDVINSEKSYVLKKLELSETEFDQLMQEKPRLHSEFKTEKKLWKTYFNIINIIKFKRFS